MRRFEAYSWILPLLVCAVFTTTNAQPIQVVQHDAVVFFENGHYEEALRLATEQLSHPDNARADLHFVAGESARRLGQFELAASHLRQLPDSVKTGVYAAADYRISQAELALGHCDEAHRYFQAYLAANRLSAADRFTAGHQEKLAQCGGSSTSQETPVPPASEVVWEDANINSSADETCPIRYADRVYFTSNRPIGLDKKVDRLYSALLGNKATPLSENPKEHDLAISGASLNKAASRMYYALRKEAARDKSAQVSELWYRDKTFEGKWGHPVRLPRPANLPDCSAAEPTCGYDARLKKEVVYFASDRPGGRGKWDIWGVTVEADGGFGEPFNLPFNSPDEEVAPFFNSAAQMLYFSSDRAGGYGGFDFFVADNTVGGWSAPAHPGWPANSDFDDRGICFHAPSNLFYFASNRPNPSCPDAAPDCQNFDIYSLRVWSHLQVSVFDQSDSTALTGCVLELLDPESGEVLQTLPKLASNEGLFAVEPGRRYKLVVSQLGFFPQFSDFCLSVSARNETVEIKVFLKNMGQ